MLESNGAHGPLPHEWRGQGPPLVLVPGLGGKGTTWEPFLSSAATRFRTLAFDPPGSGLAPPLDGPVTVRDLAVATLGLLDDVGVGRAAVMGRSMGGMIAQELALLAPDRVSALVLVATTPRADRHLTEVFELWARMAELGLPTEVRHRSSLLWCLGARALEGTGRARAYLRAKSTSDRPTDYARQARACAAHDALERLPGLRIPTLVIGGEEDRLTPPPHARALAEAIPGARLRILEGVGHLPYLEDPETFAKDVLEFLEGTARAGTQREEHRSCPSGSSPS